MKIKKIIFSALSFSLLFIHQPKVQATNLSLGADYSVRGVSVNERDKRFKNDQYYDQKLQAYLITDLSKDVEATVKIQSITPWGLEGSTTPLLTRYPNANGTPWVQNAFVRLPRLFNNQVILTLGRQPIQWGDGEILSDDDLGFNAIKAQWKSPFAWAPVDVEGFTAKITEGLTAPGDTDLHGVNVSFQKEYTKWEIMSLWEKSDAIQPYTMGADTFSVTASKINRQILGIRAKVNLKDAYLKGAGYIQRGDVRRSDAGAKDIKLGGTAYVIGLGGKKNHRTLGRFGALLEYAVGDGDNTNTPEKDEAFRPTFASRWDGLERKGYGRYFAATFADAHSPSGSFAAASSNNTGLPAGTSGIQSIRFGVESTPFAQWTLTFDYYQYKAQKNLSGPKELGTEFDYGLIYRYSGLVQFKATTNDFKPGAAFTQGTDLDFKQKAKWSSVEVEIKF